MDYITLNNEGNPANTKMRKFDEEYLQKEGKYL